MWFYYLSPSCLSKILIYKFPDVLSGISSAHFLSCGAQYSQAFLQGSVLLFLALHSSGAWTARVLSRRAVLLTRQSVDSGCLTLKHKQHNSGFGQHIWRDGEGSTWGWNAGNIVCLYLIITNTTLKGSELSQFYRFWATIWRVGRWDHAKF